MTMRWIWLVPSYIWVIVDRRAVSAAGWHDQQHGVSTGSARRCSASPLRQRYLTIMMTI
jgi:hypothetical protein